MTNNQTGAPRAFEDRKVMPPRKKLELNLNNKSSMTEALPKPIDPAVGQKQANEANAKLNDYAQHAAQLTTSYRKIISDKTLPSNKSVLAVDAERAIISQYIELGTQMNNDIRQEEGQGSMGLISLLLHTTLIQRDKINELGYVVECLERKVKTIEDKVKTVTLSPVDTTVSDG